MGLTLPHIDPPSFASSKEKVPFGLPPWLVPGQHACCHGSGKLGQVIRSVEYKMTGDPVAAWAGHCIVYVGYQVLVQGHEPEPTCVEATFPSARLISAYEHKDAIWANQPLTKVQQRKGQVAALALVGRHYDWFSYFSFLNRLAKADFLNTLNPLFADTAKIGHICSGVVVRVNEAMGTDLGPLQDAAVKDPDFICPADVLAWDLKNGWVDRSQVPV